MKKNRLPMDYCLGHTLFLCYSGCCAHVGLTLDRRQSVLDATILAQDAQAPFS